MYEYNEFDKSFLRQRASEFRSQVARRLDGSLTEDEFKPLRLMNGLYLQLHSYMLRIAIPYGQLNPMQMRQLAMIARRWDKGYGHFTTRQNIQFNWPKLVDTPDIIDALAEVDMHAIQTSGNCIRNVTSDPWSGAAVDEFVDPRPIAEMIRQWSTLHPEFAFLPRKFKVAVTGAQNDRTAVMFHDLGLSAYKNDDNQIRYRITVGGGMGRTPMIAKVVVQEISEKDILGYIEAVMRVYNQFGRRDNKYKARIKILVHEIGIEEFSRLVEENFEEAKPFFINPSKEEWENIRQFFQQPNFITQNNHQIDKILEDLTNKPESANWFMSNVVPHRNEKHSIVNITLKPEGGIPGDASASQMEAIASIAEKYGYGDIRITHEQNIVLPHVPKIYLSAVWKELQSNNLANTNLGKITDIISCPGMDYCALATARSIPIAQQISKRYNSADKVRDIGKLGIKISGCINACGHHHAGNIGVLGLERKGSESYQITLGGDATNNAAIGKIVGPGFDKDSVVPAIEKIVDHYISIRNPDEEFIDTFNRVGMASFKEVLYATS